ncbi:MAG: helix-turn-helix transcriptional regulator [Clostridia bacterium]|nr:helix-turn-helix transcriptional regulator [Clostridia bacterium]
MQVEIGKQLKSHRKLLKVSQQTIADQLNIDRSTYACYEIGKTFPPIDTLIRLSRIYNTSLEDLLGLKRERPLMLAEDTTAYDPATPMTLSAEERSLILKLRRLDAGDLGKVADLVDRCLTHLD